LAAGGASAICWALAVPIEAMASASAVITYLCIVVSFKYFFARVRSALLDATVCSPPQRGGNDGTSTFARQLLKMAKWQHLRSVHTAKTLSLTIRCSSALYAARVLIKSVADKNARLQGELN
jgi:hypothetical protein